MAKKPTYNQKKFLKANRLDPFNWLVQKDTPEFMQIIHKYSGTVRKIKKKVAVRRYLNFSVSYLWELLC